MSCDCLTFLDDLRSSLANRKCLPPNKVIKFILHLMQRMFFWQQPSRVKSRAYRIGNGTVWWCYTILAITISCDLFVVYTDIILFGDDLCVIVGVYLIVYKAHYFRTYDADIEHIITSIATTYENSQTIDNDNSRALQRNYFLENSFLLLGNIVMGLLLFVAISFQPILSATVALPLRSPLIPFTWSPIIYWPAYGFQVIVIFLLLANIVLIDNTGYTILNETSLQFELLAHRLRSLNDPICYPPRRRRRRRHDCDDVDAHYHHIDQQIMHQRLRTFIQDHQNLIKFTDNLNRVLRPIMLAQMLASMSIICLTAFEAALTLRGDKFVFLKFVAYMAAAFIQLGSWCRAGNKIYCLSTELHNAGIACDWLAMSRTSIMDLCFVMQRAQKPVTIRADPMYIMNFDSFIAILSGSYSYFTVLRSLTEVD